MSLSGVYCPITTPFRRNKIALEELKFNLQRFANCGLSGLVVFGSTGEAALLSESEKAAVLKTVASVQDPSLEIVVGTGQESTVATIDLCKRVSAWGARYVLVLTPHYYASQMTSAALVNHYQQVADNSPIPVIVYNVPKFTGLDIAAEVVAELAGHENIVGIKDSTSNLSKLTEVLLLASGSFSVLVGNANLFVAGRLSGAQGAILALANIAAPECVKIDKAISPAEPRRALDLFQKLQPVAERVVGHHGIAGIKAAMDMLGFKGGKPREPLLPVSQAGKEEIRSLLAAAELI